MNECLYSETVMIMGKKAAAPKPTAPAPEQKAPEAAAPAKKKEKVEGTNVALGKEILANSGLAIHPADTMAEGAQKIVELVKGK